MAHFLQTLVWLALTTCLLRTEALGAVTEKQSSAPVLQTSDPKHADLPRTKKQVVQLLSREWLFEPQQPPLSRLSRPSHQSSFHVPTHATNSFTVKLTADLTDLGEPHTLVEVPDVLTIRLRQHDPSDRDRQNYPAFKMPDGSVPVLEAELALHSLEHPDWTKMTIGIPLAILQQPAQKHELVLNFSGPGWQLYVDGELLDNDFPFGYPRWPEQASWTMNTQFVAGAELYVPAVEPKLREITPPRTAPGIQYWVPRGHNNWVGDVETFFYKGRYHVFYLYDRRHHQSKFGCGAHYFEHLSTADFITWTEHEAATPIEQQWECIGTGVPFVFNDHFYLSYGLHTTRVYPSEKTTLPAQWEYLKQHGKTGSFHRTNTVGVPAGATYAVSTDGVAGFKKSDVMFHPCENPSVYVDPDGKLHMLANYRSRGIWESESLEGGWRCINPSFPPGGDCTIYFRWGKFDYILGGFTGLWSKPADAPDSQYEDVVRKGLDFYDGLNVPAVTQIDGGRFLMAGWVPVRGWGGFLVLRELLQYPDGRIGSRWLKEAMPETAKTTPVAATITAGKTLRTASDSFLLVLKVEPQKTNSGKLGVLFSPERGDAVGCELQIDLADGRAQFGPETTTAFGPKQKSLREGGEPQSGGNYAIENLLATDKAFTIRIIVKATQKLGGSIIDAEIAGRRTLQTFRPDLAVSKLLFRIQDVELRNVELSPLGAESYDAH